MLVLLRHGESEWNKSQRFCGWTDVGLTDHGRQQAAEAAEQLKNKGIIPDVMFTSRLSRSCETGFIVAKSLDCLWVDVYRSWRLNERHYGALQGRSKPEVAAEVGQAQCQYWRRAWEGCPPLAAGPVLDARYKFESGPLPRGESLRMVSERVGPYYEENIRPHLEMGKTVVVVTHGSVVRSLVKKLEGVSEEDISGVEIANGEPMVVNWQP